jgi:hypothetical protein
LGSSPRQQQDLQDLKDLKDLKDLQDLKDLKDLLDPSAIMAGKTWPKNYDEIQSSSTATGATTEPSLRLLCRVYQLEKTTP